MKTKIVTFDVWVETGFAGCTHSDTLTIEVDINATDREIEKEVENETKDWLFNRIEYGCMIMKTEIKDGSEAGDND